MGTPKDGSNWTFSIRSMAMMKLIQQHGDGSPNVAAAQEQKMEEMIRRRIGSVASFHKLELLIAGILSCVYEPIRIIIWLCIYILWLYTYTFFFPNTCAFGKVEIYIIYTHMHVYICLYTYLYTYKHTYLYIYIHIYIYAYIYIYICV